MKWRRVDRGGQFEPNHPLYFRGTEFKGVVEFEGVPVCLVASSGADEWKGGFSTSRNSVSTSRSGEPAREGRLVHLAPLRPTKLLLRLTRTPGVLVSHEEIQKRALGENTFVDFEQAVKKGVKQVWAALGDDVEEPLSVETVPRRGYRFVGLLGIEGRASIRNRPSPPTAR